MCLLNSILVWFLNILHCVRVGVSACIAHLPVCKTMQMYRRMYSYCIGSVCGLRECALFVCL